MAVMNKTFLLAALLVVACDKGGGTSGGGGAGGGTGSGAERGRCYPNGTCNDGLVCLSDVCVRPPPADCAKVATKLASYRLGNYAPRDERDKVIEELRASCVAAQLSVEEGDCILEATGRLAVARCPEPLLAELEGDADGCKTVAKILTSTLVTDMGQDPAKREKILALEPEVREVVTAACTDDHWPDAVKECLGKASDMRSIDPCMDDMPKDLMMKLMERAKDIMAKIEAIDEPPPPPPPAVDAGIAPPPPVGDAGAAALPASLPSCQAYLDLMAKFVACPTAPQDQRDAFAQALDASREAWRQLASGGPQQIAEIEESCKAATAAMQQSMDTYKCQ
jgi:hypothetical protein